MMRQLKSGSILLNKLYIFLPTLGYGGAEISLSRVAQFLAKNAGVEIKLIVAKRLKHEPELKINNSLKVEYLNSKKTIFSLFRLFLLINREKPDVIISTLPTPNFMVTILKKLRLINSKIVLREANSNYLNWNNSLINKIKGKMSIFSFNNSDANIFISKELKENIEKHLSNKKNIVIYNPVFTEDFFQRANEKVSEINFKNKEIWITTSRLEHQKGLDLLFDAVHELKDVKNFILLVIGDGSLETVFKNKYSKLPIKFLGNVQNPLKYLNLADIFFFPSRREGLGNSLIEAQILGKNIISSDCPSGPKEIVNFFKNGVLFESNNLNDLVKSILNIELKQGNTVSNDLINEFSVARISEQYYDLIQEVI